jgi:hypothetical protein
MAMRQAELQETTFLVGRSARLRRLADDQQRQSRPDAAANMQASIIESMRVLADWIVNSGGHSPYVTGAAFNRTMATLDEVEGYIAGMLDLCPNAETGDV